MQSIELRGFKELDEALGKILDQLPEMRREFHEELAEIIKNEVDAAIVSSGVSDSNEKVRKWQVKHVGSGGGYAAVRAAGGKEGAEIGPNGPGAITNYLENGHKIRNPSGRSKRYRPRIRVARVPGHYFYETEYARIEGLMLKKAEEWLNQIAKELEG